jgi:YrbI family 3-deoxy-D-manno-octulosonate 8-phosphate phosphatase
LTLDAEEVARRARAIRWLISDVDGVLTDGSLIYGPEGEALKVFQAKDGQGLKLAQKAGLKVGLLSARGNTAVERRASELGLDRLILRRHDKRVAFAAFLAEEQVDAQEVAYIGDDLPDLAVLSRCGLGFCPADAADAVQREAHIVLETAGGRGAVREAVELLLRIRDQLAGLEDAFR